LDVHHRKTKESDPMANQIQSQKTPVPPPAAKANPATPLRPHSTTKVIHRTDKVVVFTDFASI